MNNNFEIRKTNDCVVIEKDKNKFSIEKGANGDIWFCSMDNIIELPIRFSSRDEEEWRSYVIFYDLMKRIVGRYNLNDDKHNYLPDDFIDLDNKIIKWHSDSEKNNTLQLQYIDEQIIVSLIKDDKLRDSIFNNGIRIRIRASGSDYGYYYQEFEKFFSSIYSFALNIENRNKQIIAISQDEPTIQKKKSLFNKLSKNVKCNISLQKKYIIKNYKEVLWREYME